MVLEDQGNHSPCKIDIVGLIVNHLSAFFESRFEEIVHRFQCANPLLTCFHRNLAPHVGHDHNILQVRVTAKLSEDTKVRSIDTADSTFCDVVKVDNPM